MIHGISVNDATLKRSSDVRILSSVVVCSEMLATAAVEAPSHATQGGWWDMAFCNWAMICLLGHLFHHALLLMRLKRSESFV